MNQFFLFDLLLDFVDFLPKFSLFENCKNIVYNLDSNTKEKHQTNDFESFSFSS